MAAALRPGPLPGGGGGGPVAAHRLAAGEGPGGPARGGVAVFDRPGHRGPGGPLRNLAGRPQRARPPGAVRGAGGFAAPAAGAPYPAGPGMFERDPGPGGRDRAPHDRSAAAPRQPPGGGPHGDLGGAAGPHLPTLDGRGPGAPGPVGGGPAGGGPDGGQCARLLLPAAVCRGPLGRAGRLPGLLPPGGPHGRKRGGDGFPAAAHGPGGGGEPAPGGVHGVGFLERRRSLPGPGEGGPGSDRHAAGPLAGGGTRPGAAAARLRPSRGGRPAPAPRAAGAMLGVSVGGAAGCFGGL